MGRGELPGAALQGALIAMHRRLRALEAQVEEAQLALDELAAVVCREIGVDADRLMQLFMDADKEEV